MMKNLILLRHAKSSWKDTSLDDFNRPLNNRGLRDAPKMAGRLAKRKIEFELIISSSSVRTADTTKIFADILGYKSGIIFDDNLYQASYKEILDLINKIDNKYNSVLIVCHNPGITNLVNFLSDHLIDDIPTTGIVGLSFNCSWMELNEKSCSLIFYDYPKRK